MRYCGIVATMLSIYNKTIIDCNPLMVTTTTVVTRNPLPRMCLSNKNGLFDNYQQTRSTNTDTSAAPGEGGENLLPNRSITQRVCLPNTTDPWPFICNNHNNLVHPSLKPVRILPWSGMMNIPPIANPPPKVVTGKMTMLPSQTTRKKQWLFMTVSWRQDWKECLPVGQIFRQLWIIASFPSLWFSRNHHWCHSHRTRQSGQS